MNGLNISGKSLDELPIKQQIIIIRQNTEEIKNKLSDHTAKFLNHEKSDKWHFWSIRLLILILFGLFGLGKFVGGI